jgi:hypothetical protein
MTQQLATIIHATKGALTARLTMNADRATIQLSGHASAVDFDDAEAIDEFSLAADFVEFAIRQGATTLHFRLNANLDEGCSARLVTLLGHAHQRGLTVRLRTDSMPVHDDGRSQDATASQTKRLGWRRSLRSAEVIVHTLGLLLSAVIGWALYLWQKFQ